MPNSTGTSRRHLGPLQTVAIVRSNVSRSALLGLLVLSASGCENNSILTPTPIPLPPSPSATLTTVRFEGRVLDEHNNQPVEGARITLTFINPGGPTERIRTTPPSTTADDAGGFSLTVDLPENWLGVTLRVDREGYDSVAGTVR